MEIIVLPYMAISFSIGWAIFAPFADLEKLHEVTFAKLETGDFLAIFIPFSILMAIAMGVLPKEILSTPMLIVVVASILIFSVASLLTGLFLLNKICEPAFLRRVAMIGIVIPLGTLHTLLWFALPLVAFAHSVFYAIPAALAVIPVTLLFRRLSHWLCVST
jgi:hypothetical protein